MKNFVLVNCGVGSVYSCLPITGFKVIDEDIMIAVEDSADEKEAGNEKGREKRNALRLPDLRGRTLWPNGIIPYVIIPGHYEGKFL